VRKLLIGLIKPAVYAYRRRRDFGVSTLPSNEDFLSRIGTTHKAVALSFPNDWTGSAPNNSVSFGNLIASDSGTSKFAENATSGIVDVLSSGPVRPDQHFKATGAFGHKYSQPLPPDEFQKRFESMKVELETTQEFLNDNSAETALLLKHISNTNYEMVDWHVDVKSGYRWDPQGWWLDQHFGNVPGVDVKIPWEISRAHDLVSLSLDSITSKSSSASDTLSLRLLDWIIANPARRGVNWRSTMEVAIRATNWIWALAIANSVGPVSPSIIWIVAKSLEQHANFIEQYPDASGLGANNHYIADMAGLAHIAAALPWHPRAEKWGEIAATGLKEQANIAVGSDGFSYEGSTGYHRFITELLTHGTLATLRYPPTWASSQIIDQSSHWKILGTMFDAADFLRKPNGQSPQFGDHDAGRLLKFHRPLASTGEEDTHDYSHLQFLLDGIIANSSNTNDSQNPESVLPTFGIDSESLSSARHSIKRTESSVIDRTRSGAWMAETDRIWLAVRCFNSKSSAPTGHLQDDALSIELHIDGQDILVDPGTGNYTADLDIRNQLRSRGQHSTAGPRSDAAANFGDVFNLPQQGTTGVELANEFGFAATYQTEEWALTRSVDIAKTGFKIIDTFNGASPWQQVFIFHPSVSASISDTVEIKGVKIIASGSEVLMKFHSAVETVLVDQAMYSPHYGTVVPTQRLVVSHSAPGSSEISFEIH